MSERVAGAVFVLMVTAGVLTLVMAAQVWVFIR